MVGKAWWPDQVVFDGGSMRQFAHFLVDQEAERDECWPLEVFLFFSFYSFQNPCLLNGAFNIGASISYQSILCRSTLTEVLSFPVHVIKWPN